MAAMKFAASGILAETGEYAFEIDLEDLYQGILKEMIPSGSDEHFFIQQTQQTQAKRKAGLSDYYDPANLAEVRWGLITPPRHSLDASRRSALERLVEQRVAAMSIKDSDFFWCEFQKGWSYFDFLDAYHGDPGEVVPSKIPYYLCIIASPTDIPWEFQQYLDCDYGVGRLWFEAPGDLAQHIDALLEYEKTSSSPPAGRWALFNAVQHPGDPATENSAAQLTQPLYDFLGEKESQLGFGRKILLGKDQATKAQFLQSLSGNGKVGQPPGIIVTSSHGYETQQLGKKQEALQGAPVFQDYPGPFHPLHTDYCLTAEDARKSQLPVTGSVACSYACFSAGTPLKPDWVAPSWYSHPKPIAENDFVARLPQELLSQGLLGFVGHVSRTSRFAYQNTKLESQHIEPYKNMLWGMAKGLPLGHTTRMLNEKWAALTIKLDPAVSKQLSKEEVVATWLARNDYRGWVLLGDPAARLNVEAMGAP
jgi:hypothetical protein